MAAVPKTAARVKRVMPLFNRVLIKKHDPLKQTASGIVLPQNPKERIRRGTVVAVGPGARGDNGNKLPMMVKPGDEVLLPDFGGTKIEVENDQVLYLFRESDILAKFRQ